MREYQWGEDARLIDWNLTARSDQPYVRQSHPDRGLDVWVSLLGVIQAGAAYVVLDIANPSARLGFILQDSASRIVLTSSAAAAPPAYA